MDSYLPGNGAGFFYFDKEFTSANNSNSNATSGNSASRRSCSATRRRTRANTSQFTIVDAAERLHVLLRRLRAGRLARELEVHAELRPPPRARERPGRAEQQLHRRLRSDGDQRAVRASTIPADPVAGTRVARSSTGGLMYAGVNGNPTTQGNPPEAEVLAARRRGLLDRHQDRAARRLRALLGAVQLSGAEHRRPATTARSATRRTRSSPQTAGTPTVTLTTRSRTASCSRRATARARCPALGTNISFVDQNRTAPRVQQWSADLQRELGSGMALTFTYIGARGDHLPLGGIERQCRSTSTSSIRSTSRSAPRRSTPQLPNPFFGNPNVPASLSTPATLTRARSCCGRTRSSRNVNARQVTEGVNSYNAGVVEWTSG